MSLAHHALHIDVHSFDQQVSLAVDFVRRVDDANQRLGRNAECEGVVLTRDRATKANDLESRLHRFFKEDAEQRKSDAYLRDPASKRCIDEKVPADRQILRASPPR